VHDHAFDVSGAGFATVLQRLAGIRQTLVLGVIERADGAYHNTALVIAEGQVVGRYRKRFLTGGESVFTAGHESPIFNCGGVRFGINICYDTQFPQAAAAAAVAAGGAQLLLVPAQNMMRREQALWWQGRHNRIRALRARETGLWLASADVTGERDEARIGLGPTCVINPTGQVVSHVAARTVGMAVAEIEQPQTAKSTEPSDRARTG
jgi:predicted amidohydrolase